MKILLLSQYFPPEFGACAARNSEHAAEWAAMGHEVTVLTTFPNYPSGIVDERYRGKLYTRETRDNYRILRTWSYATPNRAVWKRGLASVSFMLCAFLGGILACRGNDVIIASSGPFFVGPLGYLLSRLTGAALVFEVRDILPQQAVDVGMIRNKVIIRVLEAIENFLYRAASAVVVVAEASRCTLISKGVPAQKCFTIENGILPQLFAPGCAGDDVRAQHGWSDDFIAMYIGVHGVSQGLFTLLDAAKLLEKEEKIRFVFVGDGAAKPALQEYAHTHGIRNVEFLPVKEHKDIAAYYAASNACLVPLLKGAYFQINIPSKIFEIMASSRPIVLGAEGQAREIIEKSAGGLAVQPESAEEFASAILRLLNDRSLAEHLGENGRSYVLQHHDRRAKAALYVRLIEEVLQKS
ncbi:MAG: glycosyltransferase family 4 protein [Candidatus Hydrogenedentes bacterium]|nr:glycosyltransferase family 4 protein [Candidatus Hydrogenedentota bacterium]